MDCRSWEIERRHDEEDCGICDFSWETAAYDAVHHRALLTDSHRWRLLSLPSGLTSLVTRSHGPWFRFQGTHIKQSCMSENGSVIAAIPSEGAGVLIWRRYEEGHLSQLSLPDEVGNETPARRRYPFTTAAFDASGRHLFLGGADHPEHPGHSVLVTVGDTGCRWSPLLAGSPGQGQGNVIRPPKSENGRSGQRSRCREPIFARCSPRRVRVWDDSTCRAGIPNRQAVLEVLKRSNFQLAGDVIRRDCRMVVTRTRDRTDQVRMYPLIGPAKRHELILACAFCEGDSRLPYAMIEFYADHLHATENLERRFDNDRP